VTGEVKLEFEATTLNEAVMAATERWRVLVEDPEAVLPWSTHLVFFDVQTTDVQDGKIVDGEPKRMCTVRIEIDRKIVDEVTGATTTTAA
jgi:hypothetical protein